jgi:hypothetical protein
MKKEMPDEIESWDDSFKEDGGLEKILFGGGE